MDDTKIPPIEQIIKSRISHKNKQIERQYKKRAKTTNTAEFIEVLNLITNS